MFVGAHGEATFFHLSGWQRISAAFNHNVHSLAAVRGGCVWGVLPLVEIRGRLFGHALISNAFCTAGGPLALDEAARAALVHRAVDLGRELGVDYIEFRDARAVGGDWVAHTDLYHGFERSHGRKRR